MRIGVLHPGAMGSAVARCLREREHDVLHAGETRSAATRRRAEAAGMADVGTLAALFESADVVLSICPPANAQEVAREAIAARFGGLFVDGNAIAPASARAIEAECAAGGLAFVDGGLVGPPPAAPGSTRFHLSGERAHEVAALFEGSALEARVIDGPVGAASALKMAYAAWTKGGAALLLAIRALARKEGVEDALLAEWDTSQPGLAARSAGGRITAPKAWRFDGEMDEIARTFSAAGLPDGFHRAAGDVYRRLKDFKDAEAIPEIEAVVARLLDESADPD
ncbi:MAG: DUF1932 domain-containing protein [Myxococcota bacterium]